MIKRPLFADHSLPSPIIDDRYLSPIRAGVEKGYTIYHWPLNWPFRWLSDLAAIPYGSHVCLDWEPWTSQGPEIGNYAIMPFDSDVITAYNELYVDALTLVAPIARARNLRCFLYDYPSTIYASGLQWRDPVSDRVAFQRNILDRCEDEGLLAFLRTPEFGVAPAAYTQVHDHRAIFQQTGDTWFPSILTNQAEVLKEYEISYCYVLQANCNGIWEAEQQQTVYKVAANLSWQWQRDSDGSLHYRNVPQMMFWERDFDDSRQTEQVVSSILEELTPIGGYPYLYCVVSQFSGSDLRLIQESSAQYVPLQDSHDQSVCYPIKTSHHALAQTAVTTEEASVRGPGPLRAISFNGVDEAWESLFPEVLEGSESFSISVCFRREGLPESVCNVATAWRISLCVYQLTVTVDGFVSLQIATSLDGSTSFIHATDINVCDGDWHWIQCRMTGSTMSILIDGVNVLQESSSASLTSPTFFPIQVLGASYAGTNVITGYSSFQISHFGLWSTPVDDEDFSVLRRVSS